MTDITAPLNRPLRLGSIQALRGFAALAVLLFHIVELQRLYFSAPAMAEYAVAEKYLIYPLGAQGYAGVDMFFVISGFIMVYITAGLAPGLSTAKSFLWARAKRIYPLWWALCAVLTAYYMLTLGGPVKPNAATAENGTLAFMAKSLLLIPQLSEPIIGQGWTLVHEVYFYIVFAGLLFLPERIRYWALIGWAVIVGILAYGGQARPTATGYLSLSASLLTLEFIAGAGIGWLITRRKFITPPVFVGLGLITSALAFGLYGDKSEALRVYGRVMVFTLPFCALIYGLTAREITKGLRVPKWMIWLGDCSFSLYLSHLFVLGVIMRVLPKIIERLPDGLHFLKLESAGAMGNLFFALIGLTAAIICGGLIYTLIERPIMRRLGK
ncbi:MAG: acyltransferase [Robiginitomaculum sp.]